MRHFCSLFCLVEPSKRSRPLQTSWTLSVSHWQALNKLILSKFHSSLTILVCTVRIDWFQAFLTRSARETPKTRSNFDSRLLSMNLFYFARTKSIIQRGIRLWPPLIRSWSSSPAGDEVWQINFLFLTCYNLKIQNKLKYLLKNKKISFNQLQIFYF